MAKSRKRSAAPVATPAVEPPTKKRYSARLSVEQELQLRKAVLYLTARFSDRHYAHLGIFDEARKLLGLDHRSVSLRNNFTHWFKWNKDGEWERMKQQAERDGHAVYFADLIQLEGDGVANTEGDEPPLRKHAKKLSTEEKLAIAKAVLYLAPRTVGAVGRYRNTGHWQPTSQWLYPMVKELLGLEHRASGLRSAFQRWLKENKADWEEMKSQSEREAGYFGELIEREEELIRLGVLADTRTALRDDDEKAEGVDQKRHQHAEPSPSSTCIEPPHFAEAKQEAGKRDDDVESDGSGSTLLCCDVGRDDYRPLPVFEDDNRSDADDEKTQKDDSDEGEDAGHAADSEKKETGHTTGDEARHPTGDEATMPPVIVHHHHHEHHYHHPVYNFYGPVPQQGTPFPPQQH